MADYGFWRDALAGKDMSKRTHDGDPQLGFYRTRSKNKTTGAISWQPVAYFPNDGEIACRIGEHLVDKARGQDLWSYSCRYPVSEDAWRGVVERNENWPDIDATVAAQTQGQMGDNSMGMDVDEFDLMKDQIESATKGADDYKKVGSKEASDRAQGLRNRLNELKNSADAIRKRIADPLHKEWKAVNDKWNPIIKMAEDTAKKIKNSNDAFLTEQLNAQRKAEAAAAAVAEESDMMEPEVVEAPVLVPTQIRPAYGRAAAVKTVWVVKEITDYDALYQFFKGSAAVKEALEGLAKKAALDGEVPGVTREEVARS